MLDLSILKESINTLDSVVKKSLDEKLMSSLDQVTQMTIKAGVIQHFEFTYELAWKFIQRWIKQNKNPEELNSPITRKELFRKAATYGLIDDPLHWFKFGEARNLTVHTYNKEKADEVYKTTILFLESVKYLFKKLEENND